MNDTRDVREKTESPKSKLMTQADVSEYIGISRQLVRKWAGAARNTSGFPSPVRIVNRTWLFNRREIEKWAAGHRMKDEASDQPEIPTEDRYPGRD